jgi:hypothetical protein
MERNAVITGCSRAMGALMTIGVLVLAGVVGMAQDGPAGPRRFPLPATANTPTTVVASDRRRIEIPAAGSVPCVGRQDGSTETASMNSCVAPFSVESGLDSTSERPDADFSASRAIVAEGGRGFH